MHCVKDRLPQNVIHLPDHRSRLIFDLDSSVACVRASRQCSRRLQSPLSWQAVLQSTLVYRGNCSYLWDTELRPGNIGTWDGSVELLETCFFNIRPTSESSGFGRMPVLVSIQLTQACSVRATVATQERVPHGTIIQCACIRGSLLLAASYSAANSRTYLRCGVFDAKEKLLVGVANKSALSGLCPNAP
jgi:hypothetical protein